MKVSTCFDRLDGRLALTNRTYFSEMKGTHLVVRVSIYIDRVFYGVFICTVDFKVTPIQTKIELFLSLRRLFRLPLTFLRHLYFIDNNFILSIN